MTDTELPAYLAAAWGLRDRPTRGPRPALSLDRVVAAGVAVADAEGLDGLSMSRIAAELGAKPMSLYRYVESKDDLLKLMIDHAGGPPPPISAPDWRSGLTAWSLAYQQVLRAHPWILKVPITAPPATPNQLRWLEAGLAALAGSSLPPGQKISAILLVSGYVRSDAALSADLMAGNTTPETVADYGNIVASLITPTEFPELSTAIAAGVFAFHDEPSDFDFTFGLERILDGIGLIAAPHARQP